MNRLKALLLCAAALSFTLVAAASGAPEPATAPQSSAERGRAVYLNNCARCHAQDGTGNTRMGEMTEAPNLTDAAWQRRRSAARMVASVTNGRGGMPAFKRKLSKAEIASAVAYVRTLKR
jgi:cytochrome c oxidase cbb3-type subunit III